MRDQEYRAASPAGVLLPYWPEVDGLRTIAVLAVLVFHFERSWLPGGFVGVDIFFVISGFLISTILLHDLDERRFSIARFYQRRIARIAPAALLVIAATLAGGWLVYSDQEFAETGRSAAFAAASAINFQLMAAGDYFAASPDAAPLTHYWSLAVEEQFYLLFPFFLYAAVRWTRRPVAVTALLVALSFALCVAVTLWRPSAAFYLLPTRGWELGAGTLVAMLCWRGVPVPARWTGWMSWGGLALIALSILLVRERPGFPGWLALPPVLGAAATLAAAGQGAGPNRLPCHCSPSPTARST